MPTFKLKTEDGQIYNIEADVRPSMEEALAFIENQKRRSPQVFQKSARMDPTTAGGREFAEQSAQPFLQAQRAPGSGLTQADVDAQVGDPGMQFGSQQLRNLAPASEELMQREVGAAESQAGKTVKTVGALTAGVAAPAIAAEAFPALALGTARTMGAYLAKLAAQGAIGGAAAGAVENIPEVFTGEQTPSEAAQNIATSTVASTALSPLGAPIQKAATAAVGAFQGARRGLSEGVGATVREGVRGGIAGLYRPLYQTEQQVLLEAAEEAYKKVTGLDPMKSLGQTMGPKMAKLEIELGAADQALTVEAKQRALQAASQAAIGLAGTKATPEEVGRAAVAAIRSEVGPLGEVADSAIKRYTAELHQAIEREMMASGTEAATLMGGRLDHKVAGESIRGQMQTVWDDKQNMINGMFNALRQDPRFSSTTVVPRNLQKVMAEIEKKLVGAGGKPLPSVGNEATLNEAARINEFSKFPQTVEALNNEKTFYGKRVFKKNRTEADLSTHFGSEIYHAYLQDIIQGLKKASPKLSKQYQAAIKVFSDEADIMKNPKVWDFVNDVFTEGGASGETVISRLTGAQADTNLEHLERILGDAYPSAVATVRDTVSREIVDAARNVNNQVDVQKIWEAAKGVSRKIIPQSTLDGLAKLVGRQQGADALRKGGAVIDDRPEVLALLQGDKRALDALQAAKAAEAKAQTAYDNLLFKDLQNGSGNAIATNPELFVKGLFSGRYSSRDVSQGMGLVRANAPKVAEGIEEQFIADVLQRNSTAARLKLPDIEKEFTGDMAKAVFGKDKAEQIASAVRAQLELDKAMYGPSYMDLMMKKDLMTDAAYVAGQSSGKFFSISVLRSLYDLVDKRIPFYFASKWLNSPEMRAIITKPINTVPPAIREQINQQIIQESMQQRAMMESMATPTKIAP